MINICNIFVGMKIRTAFLVFLLDIFFVNIYGQAPSFYSSSDIFARIQKLRVLGSVLYLAAHPDDENNRLLTWLSKDQLLRTGYLSLTRGDGGQNLIGNEQGVELGLIRTQELLAARKVDGAEQFFSRAYDFGFSKSTDEAIKLWGKEKILADIVWVIRNFKPDVIITRFPADSRAGHGQHSASTVLGVEAFTLAGDIKAFPGQYRYGVRPWKTKRIVWNNYNRNGETPPAGSILLDVGGYSQSIGKSYGEIAAESRSQHKTQGFGAGATIGRQIESFTHLAGSEARSNVLEGLVTGWERINAPEIAVSIDKILSAFSIPDPSRSLPALIALYKQILALKESDWKTIKLNELKEIIGLCSGIWMEAYADEPFAVQGDKVRIKFNFNNRLGIQATLLGIVIDKKQVPTADKNEKNIAQHFEYDLDVPANKPVSQPYWLMNTMEGASYNVKDQTQIGRAQSDPAYQASFAVDIGGQSLSFTRPVLQKYIDPVKGEVYQPFVVIPSLNVSLEPDIILGSNPKKNPDSVTVNITANENIPSGSVGVVKFYGNSNTVQRDASFSLQKGMSKTYRFPVTAGGVIDSAKADLHAGLEWMANNNKSDTFLLNRRTIRYDHIPTVYYFKKDVVKLVNADLKISGIKVGYIEGAGDKVPAALALMGYAVTIIGDRDISFDYLKGFDAIITGIRAYNVDPALAEKKEVLNEYVRNGGNLIVQYNVNSYSRPMNTDIGPYSFEIGSGRVTDENAPVKFLLPDHPVFNFPNKITIHDFDNWIQERAVYFAEQLDKSFTTPLSMKDPDEDEQKGSLIIADYGKGKFVYTGIVFFRELPAGVPGAYRILANIIALNHKNKGNE
jgi:LmbE family N-acetylglucosaminyl deacetylase